MEDLTKKMHLCFKDELANQGGLSSGALSLINFCIEFFEDEKIALVLLIDIPPLSQSLSV